MEGSDQYVFSRTIEEWVGPLFIRPNLHGRVGSLPLRVSVQVFIDESREATELAEPGVTGMDNGQETTLLPFPGILGASLTLRHLVMMAVIHQSRGTGYGPVWNLSEVSRDSDRWTDRRSPRTNR